MCLSAAVGIQDWPVRTKFFLCALKKFVKPLFLECYIRIVFMIIEATKTVRYVHPHLFLLFYTDASQISSLTMHAAGGHQPKLWILLEKPRTWRFNATTTFQKPWSWKMPKCTYAFGSRGWICTDVVKLQTNIHVDMFQQESGFPEGVWGRSKVDF